MCNIYQNGLLTVQGKLIVNKQETSKATAPVVTIHYLSAMFYGCVIYLSQPCVGESNKIEVARKIHLCEGNGDVF